MVEGRCPTRPEQAINKMKKALITGITGQDGSFLAELLLSKGYEVHGMVRRASSLNTERIDHIYQNPEINGVRFFLHHGDLNDSSSIQSVVEKVLPDEVYNLGAQSHVHVSFEVPEYTAEITGLGTLRVLEALRNLDLSCKFYQASSSELYGKVRESPQRESTPFHPRSPYGAAKAYAFYITQNYRESYSMFACNGILFNHESERRGENFVTRKITRALGRIKYGLQKELKLGNLDAKRDWGYAGDYVEAMWLMLQQKEADDYVIGTGETRTVREFVDVACSYAGLDPKDFLQVDAEFLRPAEVELLLADPTKAHEKLGWKPKVSFEEMVRRMVERDMELAERESRHQGALHSLPQAPEGPAEASAAPILNELEAPSLNNEPESRGGGELSQDARELDQRRIRHAVYDVIAEWRLLRIEKLRPYQQEIERLMTSLLPPHIRVLDVGSGLGDLLAALRPKEGVGIDISPRMVESAKKRHPEFQFSVADVECDALPKGPFDAVVLCGPLGHLGDIQRALQNLRAVMDENARIVITHDNILWEPALKVAEKLGVRAPWPEQNRLSMQDIENLLYLSGFEVVRRGSDLLMPAHVPIVSDVINRLAAHVPGVRQGALMHYCVARLLREPAVVPAECVSVVCPVFNDAPNLRAAAARLPLMGKKTELIFVDCGSGDQSIDILEALLKDYSGPLSLRLLRNAKNKGEAIGKGFAAAAGDMLMVLDADLTVPPEDMPRFYDAISKGKGDLINGVRFVYRTEGMPGALIDQIGSQFFSSILSWVYEQPVKDSLCSAKAIMRRDYQRIEKLGHFVDDEGISNTMDLLMGAARLNMKITDLPVRYRPRPQGSPQKAPLSESRQLLRMTAQAIQKLRLG